jgi:hypothetical protein
MGIAWQSMAWHSSNNQIHAQRHRMSASNHPPTHGLQTWSCCSGHLTLEMGQDTAYGRVHVPALPFPYCPVHAAQDDYGCAATSEQITERSGFGSSRYTSHDRRRWVLEKVSEKRAVSISSVLWIRALSQYEVAGSRRREDQDQDQVQVQDLDSTPDLLKASTRPGQNNSP